MQNRLSLVGLRVGLQQDVELELLPPAPGRELEDLPQPREHHLGGGCVGGARLGGDRGGSLVSLPACLPPQTCIFRENAFSIKKKT